MTPDRNGGTETFGWRLRELETDMDKKASKEALGYVIQDISSIRQDIGEIKKVISARAGERQAEMKEQARERKIDRRWMIGTIFTAVGLVIGAMAILLPALSSGG